MKSHSEMKSSAKGRQRAAEAGFTLVELLVVLAILGLLAAVATPQVMRYLGKAKTDTAKLQVHNLAATLDLFRIDIGRYPTQEEGLQVLVSRPTDAPAWNGPYVKKADMLRDPWGVPYVYRAPGQHGDYDLFSLGADKAEGGSGEAQDVTSW
jgi:general secretion pathway protein G